MCILCCFIHLLIFSPALRPSLLLYFFFPFQSATFILLLALSNFLFNIIYFHWAASRLWPCTELQSQEGQVWRVRRGQLLLQNCGRHLQHRPLWWAIASCITLTFHLQQSIKPLFIALTHVSVCLDVSINREEVSLVGIDTDLECCNDLNIILMLFAGYNDVVRIPSGATNIDVRQHSYSGKPEDDNYLGKTSNLWIKETSFLCTSSFCLNIVSCLLSSYVLVHILFIKNFLHL